MPRRDGTRRKNIQRKANHGKQESREARYELSRNASAVKYIPPQVFAPECVTCPSYGLLPRDVLCLIFKLLRNRPLLCVVSIVCKRWRTAALASITTISSVNYNASLNVVKIFPTIKSLTVTNVDQRRCACEPFTRLASLTDLSLELYSCACLAPLLVNNCSSLTRLHLTFITTARLSTPTLDLVASVDLPALTDLNISLGFAHIPHLVCTMFLITNHRTQLQSVQLHAPPLLPSLETYISELRQLMSLPLVHTLKLDFRDYRPQHLVSLRNIAWTMDQHGRQSLVNPPNGRECIQVSLITTLLLPLSELRHIPPHFLASFYRLQHLELVKNGYQSVRFDGFLAPRAVHLLSLRAPFGFGQLGVHTLNSMRYLTNLSVLVDDDRDWKEISTKLSLPSLLSLKIEGINHNVSRFQAPDVAAFLNYVFEKCPQLRLVHLPVGRVTTRKRAELLEDALVDQTRPRALQCVHFETERASVPWLRAIAVRAMRYSWVEIYINGNAEEEEEEDDYDDDYDDDE